DILTSGRGLDPSESIAKIPGIPRTGFFSVPSGWSSAPARRPDPKPAANTAATKPATTHRPRRPRLDATTPTTGTVRIARICTEWPPDCAVGVAAEMGPVPP